MQLMRVVSPIRFRPTLAQMLCVHIYAQILISFNLYTPNPVVKWFTCIIKNNFIVDVFCEQNMMTELNVPIMPHRKTKSF